MPDVEYSDATRRAFLRVLAFFVLSFLFLLAGVVIVEVSADRRTSLANTAITVLFAGTFVVLLASVPWIRKLNGSIRRDKAAS